MQDIIAFTNGNPNCNEYVKRKKIHIVNGINFLKIDKYVEKGYQLYVFDDLAKYYQLISLGYSVKYFPIFSIDVYGDSALFEEKLEFIDGYCEDNQINCNFYDEMNPLAIKMRYKNEICSKYVWILTDNEYLYADLQEELPYVKIYINKSPFDDVHKAMEKQ